MSPILLDLGFIQIYWYSFLIFSAFLLGGVLALNEAKKRNISEEFMINLFFYTVPLALIGTRLYYVLFNLDYYLSNPIDILKVWEGGLAIHGGILTGLLFITFYTKKYKISTLRITDILVVSLILGQAIGRWGNFFNHEAYGAITSLKTLQALHIPNFIINEMLINGSYHQPTFFYESIACLIGFLILIIIRKNKYIKIGMITSIYLIYYGLIRYFVESSRMDSLMLGSIKMAQLVSILMIIVGIIMFILLCRGSIFSNRYNDEDKNKSNF